MNRFITIKLSVFFCTMSLVAASDEPRSGYIPLHENGILSHPAQQICHVLGAENVRTVGQMNAHAQPHWLRRIDSRTTKQDHPLLPLMTEHKETIIKNLRALGMIDRLYPPQHHYSYLMILSDHRFSVQERVNHVQLLTDEGYTFDHIALLSGHMPLEEDEQEGLPAEVSTQTEMIIHLYNKLPCSTKYPLSVIIDSAMIKRPDGSEARPNTDTTYVDFMKTVQTRDDLKDGSCLVISQAQYALRQTEVGKRLVDQTRFPMHAAGPASSPDTDIVVRIDEFARRGYEANIALLMTLIPCKIGSKLTPEEMLIYFQKQLARVPSASL